MATRPKTALAVSVVSLGSSAPACAWMKLSDGSTRGFLEDEKTKVAWNLPRTLQPKNRVKLLLNMMIIAQQTIPRGGTLTVEASGQGYRIRAAGLNARLPQNIADQLRGAHPGAIDAHAVQPYYTRLLAQATGLSASLGMDGDAVVVTAT